MNYNTQNPRRPAQLVWDGWDPPKQEPLPRWEGWDPPKQETLPRLEGWDPPKQETLPRLEGWDPPKQETLPRLEGWDEPEPRVSATRTSTAQAEPHVRKAPVAFPTPMPSGNTTGPGDDLSRRAHMAPAPTSTPLVHAHTSGKMSESGTKALNKEMREQRLRDTEQGQKNWGYGPDDGGQAAEMQARYEKIQRYFKQARAEADAMNKHMTETKQKAGIALGDGKESYEWDDKYKARLDLGREAAAEMQANAAAMGTLNPAMMDDGYSTARLIKKIWRGAHDLSTRMATTTQNLETAFPNETKTYDQETRHQAYLNLIQDAGARMQANAAAMDTMNPALMDGGYGAEQFVIKRDEARALREAEAQAARAEWEAAMQKAEEAFDENGRYDGSLTADERVLGVRSYLADGHNKDVYMALQKARTQGQASVQALMNSGLYTPEELARAGRYLELNDSLTAEERLASGAKSTGAAVAGGAGQLAGAMLTLSESYYGGPNAQYLQEQDDFMRGFTNQSPQFPSEMTGVNPIDPNGVSAQVMEWSADKKQEAVRNLPRNTAGRWFGETGVNAVQGAITRAPELLMPGLGLATSSLMKAGTKTYKLEKQGVNADEAVLRGLVAGGINAGAQKLPIEQWVKFFKTTEGESLLWETFEQVFGKCTKNMIGDFSNQLADICFEIPDSQANLWGLINSFAKRYNPKQTLRAGAQGFASAGMENAFTAGRKALP